LTAPEADALARWADAAVFPAAWAGWLRAQGLAPYVFYRLRQAGLLPRVPEDAAATLRSAYYAAAIQHALLSAELGALLAELRPLGIEPVLLNGMALGTALYPAPATRPTSDLDLLIERSQVEVVRRLLIGRGYRDAGLAPEDHIAFCNHLHAWREYPGGQQVVVEAHWQLVHDPGYARQIPVDELRARGRPLVLDGHEVLALDPADQLLHACAHLLLHHGQSWSLLWLLDLRLLVGRYGGDWDWGQVVQRAAGMHLAGGLRYWLGLAEGWFGPFLPDAARQALAAVRPAADEARHIAEAQKRDLRVWDKLWSRARGTADWRQALLYLGETLFPPWTYMQHRYAARSRWLAPLYYGWRVVRAGLVVFRRVG